MTSTQYPLSDAVLATLKNFASINTGILLREGQVQKTITDQKSVLAIATLETPWPQDTPVYQLNELLANLSNYEKPTLQFEEKQFVITGANSPSHVEYPYSDPSVVQAPPERNFPLDNPRAVFTLSEAAVKEIKKFSAINNLPTLMINYDGDAETIVVKPIDDKNPASRSYSYPVHRDPKNILAIDKSEKGTVRCRREYFDLIMDGSYTVTIGAWPYINLKHANGRMEYFIAQLSPKA